MIIDEYNSEKTILLHLKGGKNSKEVLSVLSEYAIKNGLAKDNYKNALLEREEKYPTGIKACYGIAIPHADQEYTNKETILVATLDKPTKFKAMGGGEDVDVCVIFMLLLDKTENQTKVLSEIVNFIQNKNKMNRLIKNDKSIIQDIKQIFGNIYEQ